MAKKTKKIKRENQEDDDDPSALKRKWRKWKKAMVPNNTTVSNEWEPRNKGHVGYFRSNIGHNFRRLDSGIYEWKASRPGARKHYVVYIGRAQRDTSNDLKRRIREYCRSGSHKHRVIDKVLRDGYELYVRVKPHDNPEDEENKMLAKYDYAWNKRRNKPYRGSKVPPCRRRRSRRTRRS